MSNPSQPGATTTEPTAPSTKDFLRWRQAGAETGASKRIGDAIIAARDKLARGLIRIGATPNRLTVLGFLVTCAAGYCLARGASRQVPYFYSGGGPASWWPALAAILLFVAGAFDMLDGAAARVGKLHTRFGGFLDSTLDRFSDMAVFLGCAWHFALIGNLTYLLLAIFALCNGFLISYVKARAETLIDDCSVGYWLRGERCAALLIGATFGHMPAVLWQLSILNFLTVWRRIDYTRRVIAAQEAGRPAPPRGPAATWWGVFQLYRHPRGSVHYDIVTGLNIAYIIFGPLLWPVLLADGVYADPVRRWLDG